MRGDELRSALDDVRVDRVPPPAGMSTAKPGLAPSPMSRLPDGLPIGVAGDRRAACAWDVPPIPGRASGAPGAWNNADAELPGRGKADIPPHPVSGWPVVSAFRALDRPSHGAPTDTATSFPLVTPSPSPRLPRADSALPSKADITPHPISGWPVVSAPVPRDDPLQLGAHPSRAGTARTAPGMPPACLGLAWGPEGNRHAARRPGLLPRRRHLCHCRKPLEPSLD